MRGKGSARSSVISVCAQLSEYTRRTHQADDEHCLLLVWIGLEARLLLSLSPAHTPFLLSKVDGMERLHVHGVYYTVQ